MAMKKRHDKQRNVRPPGAPRRNDDKRAPAAWHGRDQVMQETADPDDDDLLLAVSRETAESVQLLGPALRLPLRGQDMVRRHMARAQEWYAERRKMLTIIQGGKSDAHR